MKSRCRITVVLDEPGSGKSGIGDDPAQQPFRLKAGLLCDDGELAAQSCGILRRR